jgi:hypothetical protein
MSGSKLSLAVSGPQQKPFAALVQHGDMWQPHQGEEILRTESQPRLNIAKPESEQFAMTRQWHDQRLGRGHGEKALHESLELLGVIDEQRVCGILHHLNPRIRKLIDREHASLFAEGFDLMRLDRSGEPPARNEHQRRPNRRNASLHHVGGSHSRRDQPSASVGRRWRCRRSKTTWPRPRALPRLSKMHGRRSP